MSDLDLWGPLPQPKTIPLPRQILEQQARILTKRTNMLLIGYVEDKTVGRYLRYELQIEAPRINNYRVSIARIEHTVLIYPVEYSDLIRPKSPLVKCADDQSLITALQNTLSSAEVQELLQNLLTLSR